MRGLSDSSVLLVRTARDARCRVSCRGTSARHSTRTSVARSGRALPTRQCSVRAARVGFIVMELADFMSESWKTHTLQPKPNKTRTLDCTPGTFDYACAFGRCTFPFGPSVRNDTTMLSRSSPQRASLERSSDFSTLPDAVAASLSLWWRTGTTPPATQRRGRRCLLGRRR